MSYNGVRDLLRPKAIFAAMVFAECLTGSALAENSGTQDGLIEEDFVLSLRYKGRELSEGIFAISRDGVMYLPLGEVFSLLRFPILLSPQEGTAAGWFIDPSKSFSLSTSSGAVEFSGKKERLLPEDFVVDGVDIYIPSDKLQHWLGLSFELDLASLSIHVDSVADLPIDMRIERLHASGGAQHTAPREYFSKLTPLVPAYRVVDWPSIGFRFDNGISSDGETKSTYEASVYGDLLGLNGRLFVGGEFGEQADHASMYLGRRDASRQMLGALRLAEVKLGDVSLGMPVVVGYSLAGRGILVSNRPLAQRYDANKVDFIGVLPSGYEAELYLNSRLVDVFSDDKSGEYRFEGVLLSQGGNDIRIVLYGPRGEVEEHFEHVFVGEANGERGEIFYDVSIVDEGQSVFSRAGDSDVGEQRGLSAALNLSVGLGSGFSISGLLLENEERDTHAHFSLEKAKGGGSYGISVSNDNSGDLALGVRAQDLIGQYNGSVDITYVGEDYSGFGRPTEERQSASWRASTSISSAYSLSQVESPSAWRLSSDLVGEDRDVTSVRLSGDYDKRFDQVNLILAHDYWHSYRDTTRELSGSMRLRWGEKDKRGRRSLSSDVEYFLYPDRELKYVGLGGGYQSFNGFSYRVSVGYHVGDDLWGVSAGAKKRLNQVDFDISAFYEEDSYGFSLGWEFSLFKKGGSWKPQLRSHLEANSGRVSVLAFVDDNDNGLRESGERAVADLGLYHNGLPTRYRTDASGRTVVENLRRDSPHDLLARPETITSPELRPVAPRFALVPRPGRLPELLLPMIPTGDIEGTVRFSAGGGLGVPNAPIFVKPDKTDELTILRSEYDGLFALSGLPYGSYTVSVDPSFLSSLGLTSEPTSHRVVVAADDDYLTELNFFLRREKAHAAQSDD